LRFSSPEAFVETAADPVQHRRDQPL